MVSKHWPVSFSNAARFMLGSMGALLTPDCFSSTDVSMGLGVAMFDEEHTNHKDQALVWLYVAIAAFSLLSNFGLFLLFTGEATLFKRDGRVLIAVQHYYGISVRVSYERAY